MVESEQLLRLVDCRDSWGHDSLHHEAEFRGKKDFLEKKAKRRNRRGAELVCDDEKCKRNKVS